MTSASVQYTSAYLFMLAISIIWSLTSGKKQWENLSSLSGIGFFLSLAFYLFTLFQHRTAMSINPAWLLIRDLGLMHLVNLILSRAKVSKPTTLLLLVGLLASVTYYKNEVLHKSFLETATKGVTLASNGELLIDVKNPTQTQAIQELLQPYGATLQPAFPNLLHPEYANLDDYFVIDLPNESTAKTEELLAQLKALSSEVDWVETNEVITLDPPAPVHELKKDKQTYPLNDERIDELWGFGAMKMGDLYTDLLKGTLRPAKTAQVAILDTGVDAQHPDLKDNFFSTNPQYNTDRMGHGTHCAGIADAVSNNGIGIASFSPDNSLVKVTSIKVLDDNGMGTQQSIIQGMIEAADKGYDVISMSLGGRANPNDNRAYDEAIAYVTKSGAIIVVAAGNSSESAKKAVPAGCEGVITVSAIDSELNLAEFSNYISEISMGIAAPGVDILSTLPNGEYGLMSGTSMATPYVAGLAGIMRAVNPTLTTQQLYNILSQTGIETRNTSQSGKLIQPLAAMQAAINQL